MPHMQMFCETKAQQPSEFSDDGMQMTRLFHENGNVFVLMLLFPNKIKGKNAWDDLVASCFLLNPRHTK